MTDNPERGNNRSHTGKFLSDILRSRAQLCPASPAIGYRGETYSYHDLVEMVSKLGTALRNLGNSSKARIAVHLPNCPEAVISAFAAFEAGCVFVPMNPLYRQRQILHVLADCGASVLITTRYLFATIAHKHADLEKLETIIFVDTVDAPGPEVSRCQTFDWRDLTASSGDVGQSRASISSSDPAVIFYTSGSTGRAKGVTISHENLVDGARIVSGYLENSCEDRVLAALPLSFDYGFSQATTMVFVGGELVLTNYILPQTLLSELAQCQATGLAGVPTMWAQLANMRWPPEIANHLRYVTNSGGRLPENVLHAIREQIPERRIFLMYGLTEAFRSSYLDPSLVEKHPDSIGKAIPEVDLYVVRPDGSCAWPMNPESSYIQALWWPWDIGMMPRRPSGDSVRFVCRLMPKARRGKRSGAAILSLAMKMDSCSSWNEPTA